MQDDTWAIRILVLDRGHVIVARTPDPSGYCLWLPLKDIRTIRRWGTTAGLAQLVSGPTAETVLDALAPSGQTSVRAIIYTIDPEQPAWEPHLSPTPVSSAGSTRRARRES